jgi:hypothetical protein
MHAAAANSPLQSYAADTTARSCGLAARRQLESPSQPLPLRFSEHQVGASRSTNIPRTRSQGRSPLRPKKQTLLAIPALGLIVALGAGRIRTTHPPLQHQ